MDHLVLTPVIWPNQLRELRDALSRVRGNRLLIEDVAAAVDCSIGYLSRLEKGKARPSDDLLKALAEFYQVDIAKLSAGAPPKPNIGEANLIGAFIRRHRKAIGISIQALAQRISHRLMTPLSESSMRNIEAGHRAFLPNDEVTKTLLVELGIPSLEKLRAEALEAAESGHLEEILTGFRGGVVILAGNAMLYTDGRSDGTSIMMPARLSRYVSSEAGEYVLRLDRAVLGSALPVGTCLIGQRGTRAEEGMLAVLWNGDVPKAVRLGIDRAARLVGLRERPREQLVVEGAAARIDRVVAAVLP